jgi:phosphoribosylamine---glycine ligase
VVVGGDGRAHALAYVLGRTADALVVSGGNAGTPHAVDTPPEELDADLFVISPEAPLVEGLADRLRAQGKRVYGPGADGARLEGSKAYMKRLVEEAGVPTARHGAFDDPERALAFLRALPPPYVVKADGLAAGKGVFVTESLIEAEDDVKAKLAGASFGDAGRVVVIEEGLSGPELSVLAVCDGTRAVPLAPAQDFKRANDGDHGPNTGGMGAYSPVPMAGDDLVDMVMDEFIEPTVRTL